MPCGLERRLLEPIHYDGASGHPLLAQTRICRDVWIRSLPGDNRTFSNLGSILQQCNTRQLTYERRNPIESTFATVRHRTIRSKGCLSNKTVLAMVFKLVEGTQKSWRRIDGHNQLPKLILGVNFTDGIEVFRASAAPQAAA